MSSDENSCSATAQANPDASNESSFENSEAPKAQVEHSHGHTARHGTTRSRSLPRSSSSSPRPTPPALFSTPSSPLHPVSPPSPLPPEDGTLKWGLHTAVSSARGPCEAPSLPTPLPSASSQSAQSAQVTASCDNNGSAQKGKLADDLVAPLLRSFASLQVEDGEDGAPVGSATTQTPSPPLWYVHNLLRAHCAYHC